MIAKDVEVGGNALPQRQDLAARRPCAGRGFATHAVAGRTQGRSGAARPWRPDQEAAGSGAGIHLVPRLKDAAPSRCCHCCLDRVPTRTIAWQGSGIARRARTSRARRRIVGWRIGNHARRVRLPTGGTSQRWHRTDEGASAVTNASCPGEATPASTSPRSRLRPPEGGAGTRHLLRRASTTACRRRRSRGWCHPCRSSMPRTGSTPCPCRTPCAPNGRRPCHPSLAPP